MIRNSVVFPEPEGPSRATSSPVSIRRLTSCRASYVPKRFRMCSTSMLTQLT